MMINRVLLTRRDFLQRAGILGLSAGTLALLDSCGVVPAPTPTKIPRIGWLSFGSPRNGIAVEFLRTLNDLGYQEGKNILIDSRFSDGKDDQLPILALELIGLKVDVLVAEARLASISAKNATSTIPVVFIALSDPIGDGLVASLAHPGGNVTGASTLAAQSNGKRLQLLKDAIPGLVRVAVLNNKASAIELKEVQDAGEQLGLQLLFFDLRGFEQSDFEQFFASAVNGRVEAVHQIGTQFVSAQFTELALRNKLPVCYKSRTGIEQGAFMSYGPNVPDLYHRGAAMVDRILKGAKPADLPVEQPTKFDFVINLKTAKQLGITIPQSILAQATEVIQ